MQPVRSATVLCSVWVENTEMETLFDPYCQVSGGLRGRQVILGNGVSAGQEWFQCDFNRKSEESGGVTGLDKMTRLGNVRLRVNRTVGDHSYNYWRLYQLVRLSCQDMMIRPRPELETVQNILKSCSTIYTNTA